MLQVNDLEVISNKRVVLRLPEMLLPDATINALVGPEFAGKSLLARTLHGLYRDYRGLIDFQNIDKMRIDTYLLTNEVHLLSEKSINENIFFSGKLKRESILDYAMLAELENDLERLVSELALRKKKLLELAIACGMYPSLLIIDDFDQCFTKDDLTLVGKILSKYKSDGGTVLLTSRLRIPEMDFTYIIDEEGVVQI